MTYSYTPWDSALTEICGVLVAGTDETDLIGLGSAFLCAPYVALTARHVLEEIFFRFEGRSPTEAKGEMPFGIHFAHRFMEDLLKWDVMAYGYSPSIDISALILEPADDLPFDFAWSLPLFQALPPAIGERVTAFGYPGTRHRLEIDGTAKIRLRPHTSEGSVIEVHHLRRDNVLLPFPCLHTNARVDGGMSGGPVFNSAGEICGLVSSSMEPETPEGEHDSYVSLIWPALGLGLHVNPEPPRLATERYNLKHLANIGAIQMLNAEHVSVTDMQGHDELLFTLPY